MAGLPPSPRIVVPLLEGGPGSLDAEWLDEAAHALELAGLEAGITELAAAGRAVVIGPVRAGRARVELRVRPVVDAVRRAWDGAPGADADTWLDDLLDRPEGPPWSLTEVARAWAEACEEPVVVRVVADDSPPDVATLLSDGEVVRGPADATFEGLVAASSTSESEDPGSEDPLTASARAAAGTVVGAARRSTDLPLSTPTRRRLHDDSVARLDALRGAGVRLAGPARSLVFPAVPADDSSVPLVVAADAAVEALRSALDVPVGGTETSDLEAQRAASEDAVRRAEERGLGRDHIRRSTARDLVGQVVRPGRRR